MSMIIYVLQEWYESWRVQLVRSWAQQQDSEVDTNEVREKYTVTGYCLIRQKIKRHDLSLTIFRTRKLRREIFYYFKHYGAYQSIQATFVLFFNFVVLFETFWHK
jgi:hypothetical protein